MLNKEVGTMKNRDVFIATRLHRDRDRDIIQAIEGLPRGEVSNLIRKGLRTQVKQPDQPVKQVIKWSMK